MKNKKNAGFSLVELIVVIAIMAVLVGVLAPAYLKYVEKSRKSSDISSISDIITAASTVAADVEYDVPKDATFTITIDATGALSLSSSNTDALAAWEEAANCANGYNIKAKEWKAAGTATGTVTSSGSVDWTCGAGSIKDMCAYSKDFSAKFSAFSN